jgi:hypothetical protein
LKIDSSRGFLPCRSREAERWNDGKRSEEAQHFSTFFYPAARRRGPQCHYQCSSNAIVNKVSDCLAICILTEGEFEAFFVRLIHIQLFSEIKSMRKLVNGVKGITKLFVRGTKKCNLEESVHAQREQQTIKIISYFNEVHE